eukprot:7061603-Alexandrium_andersonii.AAC.1
MAASPSAAPIHGQVRQLRPLAKGAPRVERADAPPRSSLGQPGSSSGARQPSLACADCASGMAA